MIADRYAARRRIRPSRTQASAWMMAALVCLLTARGAPAAQTVIDFEFNPSLPTGPSIFDPAANPETLVAVTAADAPLATITGGVVLGYPNFVASFPGTNGSAPNAYGTAFFAPNLSSTLTITFAPNIIVTEVTGSVFNGRGDIADYEVLGFTTGAGTVSDYLANIPVNLDPASSATWDVKAPAGSYLTSIEVYEAAPGDGAYDFLIDNIGVTIVPEPSTWTLGVLGAAIIAAWAGRRRRNDPHPGA